MPIPDLYHSKYECCGCGACYSICPKNAITMNEDTEGFLYPIIDDTKCINCKQCANVCPIKDSISTDNANFELHSYAFKHKNDAVRSRSRSGGAFTAISDYVLKRDGVIYGCIMDGSKKAIHYKATTSNNRDKMCGSKYVQSIIGECYKDVKMDLIDGNVVLFTGTSCQVAGLHKYLGKEYENLYCVDILCHGVPSPKVLKKYIEWVEGKNGGECSDINFRNKIKFGWDSHIETLCVNGSYIDCNDYTELFYRHLSLRPVCFRCPYKKRTHPGDITLGDFWTIDENIEEFNDNKGVSLILVNNEKGRFLLDQINRDDVLCIETNPSTSIKETNITNFIEPPLRKKFWEEFDRLPWDELIKKYTKDSLRRKLSKLKQKMISRAKLIRGSK